MDPVTHSFVGAALSRAGLQRTTPLATSTLVLAANAPDIDILVGASGAYATLAFRRGVTHGPLALLVLPLAITAIMLLYDRWRRRTRRDAAPARAGPLLLLAFIGVLTHAPLDWLNTWGVRLLAPFSDRWFYGDAVFIIDPWIWLMLAGVVVVPTASRRAWVGWFSLAVLATALIMIRPEVPFGAKVVWAVAGATLVLYVLLRVRRGQAPSEHAARVALIAVACYVGAMITADLVAQRVTVREARRIGHTVEDVMIAPAPANPFASDIVVRTSTAYQLGRYRWLQSPRVSWTDSLAQGPRNAAVLETLRLPEVRYFLRWSRFPFVRVGEAAEGRYVEWGDARYPAMPRSGMGGVRVDITSAPPDPAR